MMLACGAVNDGHVNLFKCDVEAEEKGVLSSTAGLAGSVVEEWRG
jgi:regulator-associated protein of mTOR